jgi:MFS transporter, VNT family, synaptic vesicle glycoprotein 2
MYGASCFWNPIFANLLINQDWSFYIEPLDLVFKPWRLFMIVCATPNVVCGLVMLFFMPESPKFTFSHGDEAKTLQILHKVYCCNTGLSKLTFKVKTLVKDEEYQESTGRKSKNLFEFMWLQTLPLFKHPHLRNTLTACFIQFCIFNTSNGFWTFFPEITNRIALWKNDPSHMTATVCQILDDTQIVTNFNSTVVDLTICVTKLQQSTFKNSYILNFVYLFGWLFLSLIINRVGKLIIITTVLFICGTCGFALIFVSQPVVSSYLYIVILADGLALTVLNASTIELFPTQFRFVKF